MFEVLSWNQIEATIGEDLKAWGFYDLPEKIIEVYKDVIYNLYLNRVNGLGMSLDRSNISEESLPLLPPILTALGFHYCRGDDWFCITPPPRKYRLKLFSLAVKTLNKR